MHPTRGELQSHQVKILNQGRFANATVSLCRLGEDLWVMKDLAPKKWIVRVLYARHIMRNELNTLMMLQGLKGIPQDACRLDKDAIAYRHIPARVLADCLPGEYAPGYFPALEKLVHDMHARGVAHLDIRYMHNVLVCDDETPALIDFQTAVTLPRRPQWLSRFLRQIDISGVYKHWRKRSPETLDPERLAQLERQNRWRKYWILSSYFGRRGRDRKRMRKQMLKEAKRKP